MSEITRADLQAIGDVAANLAEQSDSLSAEQAVTLLTEARAAYRALGIAIGLLETQALSTIEQPILVGTTAWSKKPEYKRRPDQSLVTRCVTARAAAPDENGELPTVYDAAERATSMMFALYVSPSTLPKVSGVKALGLSMNDVTSEELTGYSLKETEL